MEMSSACARLSSEKRQAKSVAMIYRVVAAVSFGRTIQIRRMRMLDQHTGKAKLPNSQARISGTLSTGTSPGSGLEDENKINEI